MRHSLRLQFILVVESLLVTPHTQSRAESNAFTQADAPPNSLLTVQGKAQTMKQC